VNAGSPDMKRIESKEVSDSLNIILKQEREQWQKGTLKPKGHED